MRKEKENYKQLFNLGMYQLLKMYLVSDFCDDVKELNIPYELAVHSLGKKMISIEDEINKLLFSDDNFDVVIRNIRNYCSEQLAIIKKTYDVSNIHNSPKKEINELLNNVKLISDSKEELLTRLTDIEKKILSVILNKENPLSLADANLPLSVLIINIESLYIMVNNHVFNQKKEKPSYDYEKLYLNNIHVVKKWVSENSQYPDLPLFEIGLGVLSIYLRGINYVPTERQILDELNRVKIVDIKKILSEPVVIPQKFIDNFPLDTYEKKEIKNFFCSSMIGDYDFSLKRLNDLYKEENVNTYKYDIIEEMLEAYRRY